MIIQTLKRFEFSAARQLENNYWDGSNFIGWAGVTGQVDPHTGMLINITALKQVINAALENYDHHFLNHALDPSPPTNINIATALRHNIASGLPAGVRMNTLRLDEEDEGGVLVENDAAWQTVRGWFSAAHRTHAPRLSAAQNIALYGKCNNPAGHGHNYVYELQLPAGVTPRLGFWDELDHHNLSVDIPDLANHNVTTERIAQLIANRVPGTAHVRLWETPDFFAEYVPNGQVFRLGRVYRFHAAHRLNNPALSPEENQALYGKCNRPDPHGHTYKAQVTVQGTLDTTTDTVFDLARLEAAAGAIIDTLDHKYLDLDVPYLAQAPSTGENIALYLFDAFEQSLNDSLVGIEVSETPNNRFVVTR
jgi:6-pyruvoyltetrahydropterin/6-carboxytetrahydropterin synthase